MDKQVLAPEAPASRVIAGAIVVAFVLAFSRWGTNIGVNVLFVSDVLIGFAISHYLLTRWMKGDRRIDPSTRYVTALFAMFLGFVVVRFGTSIGQSGVIDWLRDAIPFLYGFLALLSAASLARSSSVTRAATVRLFRWALTIHLFWVAAVGLSGNRGGFDILGPFSSAPMFEIRPDIDVALIAVAAALNLRQFVLGRRRFWNAAGIVLALPVVFITTATRAGQISLLLCLAASFAFTYAASRHVTGRRLLMVFAVPAVIAASLAILPTTTAGERLIATIVPQISQGSSAERNAQGTQRAREITWQAVIDWTNEEPSRAIFGSGFGNDFLEQSGTKAYLEGTTYTNVRSPHNWFVGIYARMGVVGTVLAVAWVAQLLLIMWRRREVVGSNDLLAMSALTFLAVLPVATLGVVLEAPFGAIPFFWSAGIIMAWRTHRDPDGIGLVAIADRKVKQKPSSLSHALR